MSDAGERERLAKWLVEEHGKWVFDEPRNPESAYKRLQRIAALLRSGPPREPSEAGSPVACRHGYTSGCQACLRGDDETWRCPTHGEVSRAFCRTTGCSGSAGDSGERPEGLRQADELPDEWWSRIVRRAFVEGKPEGLVAWEELQTALAAVGPSAPSEWLKGWLGDRKDVVDAVLKAHTPTSDGPTILCACGWSAHRISATAWHRHAAAMVLNALTESLGGPAIIGL